MLRLTATKPTMLLRFPSEVRPRANARNFIKGSDVRFQAPPRVEIVEADHRSDGHGTIHDVEVQFVPADMPIPTVGKLNGPINRPKLEDQHDRMEIRLTSSDAPDVQREGTKSSPKQH